ncbi:hypothetical protein ACF3OH_01000 [Chryseomicrobium aureum]|uniref:hypothetical protein n=1 Tax=Chryseomicrobium aureum TaxID=1441723 RepID=UPI00195CC341|nr:hypothetical protein [Chryseomicrobium aureum]MBM7707135.1 hypothetical protein [Chryseomicrobium aureum]
MKNRVFGTIYLVFSIALFIGVQRWPYLQDIDPIYHIPLYFPALVLAAIGLYLYRISLPKEPSS